MDRRVDVTAKWIYGKVLFYPANLLAERLATFAKCKAFTREQVDALAPLEYVVDVAVPFPLPDAAIASLRKTGEEP